MSPYAILAIPASFVGLAVVLAVIRADPKDLPAIIRALRGMGRVTTRATMTAGRVRRHCPGPECSGACSCAPRRTRAQEPATRDRLPAGTHAARCPLIGAESHPAASAEATVRDRTTPPRRPGSVRRTPGVSEWQRIVARIASE
jgi:hypothetical protein